MSTATPDTRPTLMSHDIDRLRAVQSVWEMFTKPLPHHAHATLIEMLIPVCGNDHGRAMEVLTEAGRLSPQQDSDLTEVWRKLRESWLVHDSRLRIRLELSSGHSVYLEETATGLQLHATDDNVTATVAFTPAEMVELMQRYTQRRSTTTN